jgi:uncharacterized protein YbjT (DUF2867 family)
VNASILVTGGTGRLGRHVVAGLLSAGHEVRVLSRHGSPPTDGVESVAADLRNEGAIQAAVDGMRVIVHCAGSGRGDDETT